MAVYKLIIVDDEPEIRDGLQTFGYSEFGIELVGSYENGLIAYQHILSEPVDIVVTDIRMPLMDGLELAERINNEFGFIKTITLSGYDDFQYARKCLKHGVIDYLLKPLDFNELKASLVKAIQLLNEKKQMDIRNTALERRAKFTAKLFRRNFLKELMNRQLTEDELEEGSNAGEILLESKCYTVSIVKLDSVIAGRVPYSDKDWNLILFVLDNIISEMWDEKYGYHYVDRQSGNCFILAVSPETHSDELMHILQTIKQGIFRFRGLLRTTISIGIGSTVDNIRLIPSSRSHAQLAIDNCNAADACIRYTAITPAVPRYLDEDEVKDEEHSLIETAAVSDSGRKIVEEAKKYIHTNYERTITLSEVAQCVHVNASYLSFLFKKTTGENFVVYLTSCRIQKAKLLLSDVRLKIYEIGEMVGFENPRYFGEIFKRYTGKTPQEYRNFISSVNEGVQ